MPQNIPETSGFRLRLLFFKYLHIKGENIKGLTIIAKIYDNAVKDTHAKPSEVMQRNVEEMLSSTKKN